MKKIFEIFSTELNCPYCGKRITYSYGKFKARYECEHCKTDLIIRAKMSYSTVFSILGFILLLGLKRILGIGQLGALFEVLYLVLGCMVYLTLMYKVLCKIKGGQEVFKIDFEDPTLINRMPKRRK